MEFNPNALPSSLFWSGFWIGVLWSFVFWAIIKIIRYKNPGTIKKGNLALSNREGSEK